MSLDVSKLEKVKQKGCKIESQCPACFENGEDKTGNHLVMYGDGAYGCAKYPDDDQHSHRIFELAGIKDRAVSNGSPPRPITRQPVLAVKDSAPRREVCAYPYTDENGTLIYEAVRYEPKDFRQRRMVEGKQVWNLQDVERVPYQLPEVVKSSTVWIVEGEKDADELSKLGVCATCRAGGSSTWEPELTPWLTNKEVILCGDNDPPGEKYMALLESFLKPVAKSVRRVWVPRPHKDISDVLEGLGDEEARAAIDELLRGATYAPSDGITRKSFLELYLQPPDETQTLLGNRWLCRRGCVLMVAPTGVGKSSASAQMDVCWTAGKPAFGIIPAKPLRILTIQVENDDGDLHEMARGVVNGMGLSESEIQALGSNNRIVTMPGKMGMAFAQQLDKELTAFPCDILRIDPVTGFFGDDVKDSKAVNQFCREWLQPLLDKHNCGLILILHTPKTNHRDTSNWKDHDWMYAGAGSADWSNFARAILIIEPKEYPLFELRATKRKQRIGWKDANGLPLSEKFWAHSMTPGEIFWEPASPEQQKENAKAEKTKYTLLELVPMKGTIEKKALVSRARTNGIGDNRADNFIAELIHDGLLEDVPIPRSGTRPAAHVKRVEVR